MKKSKSTLKIVALILAVFLIFIILSITNSFVGNPISSAIADKAIKDYVAQNYSSLNLEIEKSHYNFKDSAYTGKAKSSSSIDTHFNISYRGGKVLGDDYESSVSGKFNTLTRLEDEYSKLVIPLLSKIPGLEKNTTMVEIEKWEYEKANDTLKPDMKFDRKLPIQMKVNIRTDLNDNSLKNVASILENSHKILLENGCVFTSYDIFSQCDGVIVMISDVSPTDIESGELEKLLQAAKNYEDPEAQTGTAKDNGRQKPEPVKKISVFINDTNEKNNK